MGFPASVPGLQRRQARRRVGKFLPFLVILLVSTPAQPQYSGNSESDATSKTVLGVRNLPLKRGAELLIAGRFEEGVQQTHQGMEQAVGDREHEAALSNLCAGYLRLGQYETALQYCEILLVRNDKYWRAYNNRALIYILTEQWDKAEADLIKGEEINAGAHSMKMARAMYMDAVHPVAPEVEIDDRESRDREK